MQGDVGATGLEHGEQRHDDLGGPRHQHGHQVLGADAERGQPVGQPVRPIVQLAVGHLDGPGPQGHGLGGAGGLRLEGPVHAVVDGRLRRAHRVAQEAVPLLRQERVQLRDPTARPCHRLGQDRPQASAEGVDGVPVEQVGAVLDHGVQAALGHRPLDELEGEVELGHGEVDLGGLPLEADQVERLSDGPPHRQHDLEQGVAGQRAARVDRLDDLLERHVLVGEGGQVRLPDPAQQFQEARVARQVGAQHQGVDEEPGQFLQRLLRPARGDRAERDVGARAEPGEQHGERGLHHHEGRAAVGAGHLGQARGQFRAQVEVDHGPGVVRNRGPGAV